MGSPNKCYLCVKSAELTSEHIIPQCLGGVLAAPIFCAKCNSEAGLKLDAELAKHFGRYATLLNVKRERGKNQTFRITDEKTGMNLVTDGVSIARQDPIVRVEKDANGKIVEIEVIGRSEAEREQIFQGLAEKHNFDLALVESEYVENPAPSASHEFVIDTPELHRAIAKIAYGFACTKLPAETIFDKGFDAIRGYISNSSEMSLAHSNYAHGNFMVDGHRPLHKIHLSINRGNPLIVAYVTLFGTFRYTVLLSDSFNSDIEWPGIDYTYNPATQQEVPTNLNFKAPALTKDQVVSPKQSMQQVSVALQKGQEVIADHSQILEGVDVEVVTGYEEER